MAESYREIMYPADPLEVGLRAADLGDRFDRDMLADLMEDAGRYSEADYLRSPNPVRVRHGCIEVKTMRKKVTTVRHILDTMRTPSLCIQVSEVWLTHAGTVSEWLFMPTWNSESYREMPSRNDKRTARAEKHATLAVYHSIEDRGWICF